mmetsp:Transcript_3749/g.8937  ORF Transcript_3749/g.8937 Transcript_3749/m.8937 type:complete len:96 (-) Transcript_3749:253-540(-)
MSKSRGSLLKLVESGSDFLSSRDGIDKLLKCLQYTAKLYVSSEIQNDEGGLAFRLERFGTSVGLSRWLAPPVVSNRFPTLVAKSGRPFGWASSLM